MSLTGKRVLITGGARRIGKALALGIARAGGVALIHYGLSHEEGIKTLEEIHALGQEAHLIQADLNDPEQAANLVGRACELGSLFGLVNNAAIFESPTWDNTNLGAWQRHLNINLTAPFLLSQAFASQIIPNGHGRIINILDWRALRPGGDHLPYTISKAGLAALTQSLAISFAPYISVNGIALGAILPPSDGADIEKVSQHIPAKRWANPDEVVELLLFLLDGPPYITGEIIHVDGGRHLV